MKILCRRGLTQNHPGESDCQKWTARCHSAPCLWRSLARVRTMLSWARSPAEEAGAASAALASLFQSWLLREARRHSRLGRKDCLVAYRNGCAAHGRSFAAQMAGTTESGNVEAPATCRIEGEGQRPATVVSGFGPCGGSADSQMVAEQAADQQPEFSLAMGTVAVGSQGQGKVRSSRRRSECQIPGPS